MTQSFVCYLNIFGIIIRFNLPPSAVRHTGLFVPFVGIVLSVFRALSFFYFIVASFSDYFPYFCAVVG